MIIIYKIWHWQLLPVLPLAQLRMLKACCISLSEMLINDKMPRNISDEAMRKYPIEDYAIFNELLIDELKRRGELTGIAERKLKMIESYAIPNIPPFVGWHNRKYLIQCISNLSEKKDNGKISDDEWKKIRNQFKEIVDFIEEETL